MKLGLRLLSASALAGLSACAACPGEETLAEDPGPPGAKLVRVHGFHGRGRLGGIDDYAEVRVASSPARRMYVCSEPKSGKVKVEPGGRRVAARCDGGPWKMLWLGDEGRTIELCNVLDDPSADWAKAPTPLTDPARAVGCAGHESCSGSNDCTFKRVRAEIEAAGDKEALEKLVAGTTGFFDTTLDVWTETWTMLPEAARARVNAELCGAIGDPEAKPIRAAHAMLVCDWESEASLDAIERTLEAHSKRDGQPLDGSSTVARWGVVALTHARPEAASKWACKLLEQGDRTTQAALALSKEPCPALESAGQLGYTFCCGEVACTPKKLEDLVSRTMAKWRDQPVPRPSWPPSDPELTPNVAWLAAMHARGLLNAAGVASQCRSDGSGQPRNTAASAGSQ